MSAPVRLAGDGDRFEPALLDAWRELAELRGNPFLTPEWFLACREALDEGEPLLLVWEPEGRVRGVLPLVATRSGGLRVLRFAGSAWGDWFTPACRPEDEAAMGASCASWLSENHARWHLLDLTRVAAESAWPAALWEAGEGIAAPRPRRDDVLPCIRVPEGGYEEYLASRSRNFRSQLGRRRRKLERDHGLSFRLTAERDELDRDLDVFFELHEERWRARGGSSALRAESKALHRSFAAAALERGWLRLWTADVDGEPGASWYGWRIGERYCYSLSGLRAELEPLALGTVLLAHTIEQAAAEGAAVYDLMRGDEAYKTRFETDRREAQSWTIGRRRHPVALAVAGRDRVAAGARRLPPFARTPLKALYRIGSRR